MNLKYIALIAVLCVLAGVGCVPVFTPSITTPQITEEHFDYSFNDQDAQFSVNFDLPDNYSALGPLSCAAPRCVPNRTSLQIYLTESAPTTEEVRANADQGFTGGDVWVWWLPGELSVEQVVGICPTCQTSDPVETTYGQHTGLEFVIGYSNNIVFMFYDSGYTFAVFDTQSITNPKGPTKAVWEHVVSSLAIRSLKIQ